jgi:DNA primase large subunit
MNKKQIDNSIKANLVRLMLMQGLTVDQILEKMKNDPDYNEKVFLYNVEYLAGLKGKKK